MSGRATSMRPWPSISTWRMPSRLYIAGSSNETLPSLVRHIPSGVASERRRPRTTPSPRREKCQTNAFACALHLFLAAGVGEAREAGHEVVEDGETGEPRGEWIAPLDVLRIGKAGEEFRDEKERRDHCENGNDAQEKLHAITHVQAEIACDEGEESSWE